MSVDFVPLRRILARELFDGRLEKMNIHEHINPDATTERSRCLTDGRHYLWVFLDADGFVDCFTAYGFNAPAKILVSVAKTFETDIVSEYEPQYWGYDTQEEWDAAEEERAREHRERAREDREQFYIDVVKHVKGETSGIKGNTIGMQKTEIAKQLVAEDPELLLPVNKDKLLEAIESIYDRDHAVKVGVPF